MVRRPPVLGLAAALAGLFCAASVRADEAPRREYVIDEHRPQPSAQWKLVVGGIGTTLGFYAAAQPFSYAWPNAQGAVELRYPLIGPWLSLGHDTCPPNDSGCSKVWLAARGVLLVLDGLGQAGGLAVMFEGMFLRTESAPPPGAPGVPGVPAPKKPSPQQQPEGDPTKLFFIPKPVPIGQNGLGLGIFGVF